MPWTTPLLRDLRILNRDAITGHLPGADAALPNSPLRILSDRNAEFAYANLEYLDWQARQLLPDTAEAEFLERHAAIWVGGRKAATEAYGTVLLTGVAGTEVPLGLTLASAEGLHFLTSEPAVLGAAATAVPVSAVEAGSAGNLDAGTTLTPTTAIAGLGVQVTVQRLLGGIDQESDDSLRDRVLTRIRQPPNGGSRYDYIEWARSVPGVTRAWAAQELGPGTVTVRVMMDDDRPGGMPTGDDLTAVLRYIDPLRPVSVADLAVVAPIPFPVDLRIRQLSRSTASTVAAIEAVLRTVLRQRGEPGGTVYRSWIEQAIAAASGVDHFELDFATTPMPSRGHLPVLGTITYGS